jgi:hypothetical protein
VNEEKSNLHKAPDAINIVTGLFKDALSGDAESAAVLFMIAFQATDSLREIALQKPEVIAPFSSGISMFPAMICPNNSKDDEHKKLLKNCRVGEKSLLNASSTTAMNFGENTPGKTTAVQFYIWMIGIRDEGKEHPDQVIQSACRSLPEPSRNTFKEWNRVMQQMLIDYNKNDPKAHETWALWLNIWPSKTMTPGKKIDEIKKQISQGLYSILPEQ